MEFQYLGLQAELELLPITDQEVDQRLLQLQNQNPKRTPVTGRAAQQGDEIVLDYTGFCDGKLLPGGSAQGQTLVLGSGMLIPGFEEQLVGAWPEQPVTVSVTFPQKYHAPELSGKPATFQCVIHQIRLCTPSELNDDFAKSMGDFQTLEELRQALRQEMQQSRDQRAEMDLQDRLIRQAAQTLEFTPTEAQIDRAVEGHMETLRTQLARQNLTMEMYCQFTGQTVEALRAMARDDAAAQLRVHAAIDRIIRLEQLELSEEEIAQGLEVICRQNHMTMEQFQPMLTEDMQHAIQQSLLAAKVMELVRNHAAVTVKTGA